MTIHLPEDLANSIRAQVRSGQFPTEDEMVAAVVREYLCRQNHNQAGPSKPAAGEQPSVSPRKPIWEEIEEITASIPDEEFLKLPRDGAEQHDHYIYGVAKRPASP